MTAQKIEKFEFDDSYMRMTLASSVVIVNKSTGSVYAENGRWSLDRADVRGFSLEGTSGAYEVRLHYNGCVECNPAHFIVGVTDDRDAALAWIAHANALSCVEA